ncbi:MAG: DUF2459 domain-containing protein [Ghiorsea sp.]
MRYFLYLLLLFFLSSCAGSPHVVNRPNLSSDKAINHTYHEVWVAQHGWHTSIFIAAPDIQQRITDLKQRFPAAQYLSVGWGDESIYQADEVHFLPATNAILLPTNAVLHVVAHQNKPRTHQQTQVQSLCLNDTGYPNLLTYIENSFGRDSQQHIIPTDTADGVDSQFYEAKGTYYFLNTCNTWVGKALASAGYDISPVFRPTASQIMSYLKSNAIQPNAACEALTIDLSAGK